MMRRMQEDMDRLFTQVFGAPGALGTTLRATAQWSPSMDISESDREWCIEADLPGVKKEDMDVEVRDQHLFLRAEIREEAPTEPPGQSERQYHRRERRYGRFERAFPLPDNVDEDQIRCDFSGGVLRIHLPKSERAQERGRRIPIGEEQAQPAPRPAPPAPAPRGNGRNQPVGAGAKGGEKAAAPPKSAK
jgi:HSP20 family protein